MKGQGKSTRSIGGYMFTVVLHRPLLWNPLCPHRFAGDLRPSTFAGEHTLTQSSSLAKLTPDGLLAEMHSKLRAGVSPFHHVSPSPAFHHVRAFSIVANPVPEGGKTRLYSPAKTRLLTYKTKASHAPKKQLLYNTPTDLKDNT